MKALPSVLRTLPSLILLTSGVAFAADAGETSPATEAAPAKRGGLFPAFRKKQPPPVVPSETSPAGEAAGSTPEAGEAGADEHRADEPRADEPAQDQPSDGVLEWVDRMEGEIPSREQIEAVREQVEEESAQRTLVDDLTGSAPPLALYSDPRAAMTVDPLYLDLVDPSEFDIPIETNEWVAKWVRYFTGDGRKHYERWLSRSTRYQPMMRAKLREEGLPQDLVYLSMIESGYNTHAYSSADAAGLWQFISSTGKLYDLRIDFWVDERRDPEAALEAATTFLDELHTMFGDWRLAWASYNGGPGRVRRATEKAGSKDFWTLADGAYLHPETDNYVPKIMAAAIIGHHPERYGFTGIEFQSELTYETSHVDGSVEFDVLARCAGTTVEHLKDLNPALRRLATPPEGYDLRIPVGARDTFVTALAAVPKEERVVQVQRHIVRRGETLSTIASKYHTSVTALSRANNLKNINHIYVGMNLTIPRAGGSVPASAEPERASSSSVAKAPAAASKPATVHTVARGDTLSGVADRYHVTTTQLRQWNGLSSSTILVGQKLKVSAGSSGGGTTAAAASAPSSSRTHTVGRGETLASIARKYGVSTADLQKWNGIRDASHIEVGQRLKVGGGSGGGSVASASSGAWTTVTVQRGESLGVIAERHGCSVTELKSWNGLSSSVIQPGQKLKVKRG